LNNVINGEHIRYANGAVSLRENFVNGVLDGIYEMFSSRKLFVHLEFKNGKLEGAARGYDLENGILDYEGHYKNGLQDGIFRIYNRTGDLESEVVFEAGKLVTINKLPPLSDIP
jgi:antitoxin component YwqK of YwqJK toxin-antitoxin module